MLRGQGARLGDGWLGEVKRIHGIALAREPNAVPTLAICKRERFTATG